MHEIGHRSAILFQRQIVSVETKWIFDGLGREFHADQKHVGDHDGRQTIPTQVEPDRQGDAIT